MARRRGHDVKLARASLALALDPAPYDAIIVVSPVYLGRHERRTRAFLAKRAREMSDRPSAFLAVSGAAGSRDRAERARAEELAQQAVRAAGARVRLVLPVGGAIAYPRYGYLMRLVVRRIARKHGEPVDTSRTHDLTDWGALEHAMAAFLGVFPPVRVDAAAHALAHA
jgi:menaquinone-dependent protoporphyrinogen oxidase